MRSSRTKGYSLIELIIAMALLAIISGIIATIIGTNFQILDEVSERKKVVTRGMLAVNLFQRELGMLTDSTNIVIADDKQFQFNDKYGNTWEYKITSDEFTRQEIGVGSAMVLASPIVNADTEFKYYAGDNSELSSVPLNAANMKLIRLVKLMLVMDDGFEGVPLMAWVFPENLSIYNKPLEQ
jgi:prepilin-type N-terminal cleavage/methylation domain-containing protein